jgi:acetyl esterase/lipase
VIRARLAALAAALTAGCSSVYFFLANAPAAFGPYERTAGVPYGDGPRRKLDVYAPKGASGLPVVVFWYGGSWTSGDKARYRFVGAALAERGFVVVIPDYRLHPEVCYPAFVDDGAQVVAWVQRHAGEYGGDPHRIVLAGHSAGAYTAAYLALNQKALREGGADPASIRGLIGLAGPYTLNATSDFLRAIFRAPYGVEDWQPVRFVDPSDPPALLVHGGADRTVDVRHTIALRDALERAGVRVETEIYPEVAHVDLVAGFSRLARGRAPVLERAVRFARDVTSHAEARVLSSFSSPVGAGDAGEPAR